MSLESLLREIIADGAREIEGILQLRGDASHAAALRCARNIKDQVLAEFICTESAPAYIRDRLNLIASYAKHGELESAYAILRTLRLRLDMISQIVRAPIVNTALKQRYHLSTLRTSKNDRAKIASAAKIKVWQEKADEIWSRWPKRSKVAVATLIKRSESAEESVDWITRCITKVRRAC